jgi:dihydropteroate synthase
MKTYSLAWNGFKLNLGKQTALMGILNVTPDSFSDGGLFYSHAEAVAQGEKMAAEGADIIDVGGESTRPFSEPVPAEEEIRRVIPVIKKLALSVSVPISIDTTKADVARAALDAGASIINDISALSFDKKMAGVIAEAGVPVVIMHMQGNPKTMQKAPVYQELIPEIIAFLRKMIDYAQSHGISKSKILVDPGIGFGKTFGQNFEIIDGLADFAVLDVPILIGPSRKAFIRNALKVIADDAPIAQSMVYETGTQAAIAAAILNGAHIVRVHNVANTAITAKIIDAIKKKRR